MCAIMTDMSPAPTGYVSVHLTAETRDALRTLTINVQHAAGRRLSMSQVALAAFKLTETDVAQVLAEIDRGAK